MHKTYYAADKWAMVGGFVNHKPSEAQWLLYVPPGSTAKNYTFCPVYLCILHGYEPCGSGWVPFTTAWSVLTSDGLDRAGSVQG